MASGLCVRVLLLSLLAFGPHAEALSYRSGGSSGVTPYFKSPSALLGDQNPGLASSSYESSAQADGSQGGSGPSYPEGGSSDELEPAGAGSYTGYYGRQVDGNNQERSVSSYRPDPIIPSKPKENPMQPSHQANLQTKKGMWNLFPNNGNAFQLGTVSSSGIMMEYAPSSDQPKPQQPSSYQPKPQQPSSYQPRPQQPSSYQPRPQQPSSYQPRPQQPSSYQPKPQQPSSYQPQQPSSGTPSTDDMWDFALSHDVAFDPYEELPTYPEVNVGPRNFRPTYMVAPNHPGWQQRVAR
ncbi:adhesive plaque matrix protein-like [Hippoglossus hippoglossus]|uniref:adhesive plaque matrix protein-like n=1 Tax=Hippoglossus hippoglossus TaxID=8267 RepID=UPI00148BF604|nr:adhesive plaque matrix protein-like [Hippoglossus hippoglossus]